MQLELDAADSELLEQILVGRLGDLRMEISNTDDFDFRKGLKDDEGRIKSLLERLRQGQGESAPAAAGEP
ncbi:MAG TPA: hypothetical protein VNK05_08370 [Chloroflexota bacterium]|nr:hypothetical protein [Chloroflexota bacterium]